MKKCSIAILILFVMNIIIPCHVFAQTAVPVLTLANGTKVSMTSAQLGALASQPGIAIKQAPFVSATQISIPVPTSLGGGFLVGEPGALAAGMNAVGITTGATAPQVAGATAAAGAIAAGGSVAGAAATTGIGAGTIAIAVGAAAAAIAIGIAAGSSSSTTNH
jgi:hypothetical protein